MNIWSIAHGSLYSRCTSIEWHQCYEMNAMNLWVGTLIAFFFCCEKNITSKLRAHTRQFNLDKSIWLSVDQQTSRYTGIDAFFPLSLMMLENLLRFSAIFVQRIYVIYAKSIAVRIKIHEILEFELNVRKWLISHKFICKAFLQSK